MPSQSPSLEFCVPKGPSDNEACNFEEPNPSTTAGVSAGSCIGPNACIDTTKVTSIGFKSCRTADQLDTVLNLGVCQNMDGYIEEGTTITIGEQSW